MNATLLSVVIVAASAVPANQPSASRVGPWRQVSQAMASTIAGSRICASPKRVSRCQNNSGEVSGLTMGE